MFEEQAERPADHQANDLIHCRLFHLALANDFAIAQHRDAVAQGENFFEDVGLRRLVAQVQHFGRAKAAAYVNLLDGQAVIEEVKWRIGMSAQVRTHDDLRDVVVQARNGQMRQDRRLGVRPKSRGFVVDVQGKINQA